MLVHETMYVPAVEKYIKGQIAPRAASEIRSLHGAYEGLIQRRPKMSVASLKQAGVKTLVLSHITPAIDSVGDDTWREPAAKFFKGEIIVGKDLMVV